jgi:hypothetical protein
MVGSIKAGFRTAGLRLKTKGTAKEKTFLL